VVTPDRVTEALHHKFRNQPVMGNPNPLNARVCGPLTPANKSGTLQCYVLQCCQFFKVGGGNCDLSHPASLAPLWTAVRIQQTPRFES
jgi:hypothetical protein